MRALLGFLLLAVPAAALDIEHEEHRIIGWNDSCSVAVERYVFPKPGEGIHDEPITSRVGTLTLATEKTAVETRWVLEADGVNSYDQLAIERIRKTLRKAGYDRPGFHETIRTFANIESAASAAVIRSTAILESRLDIWPDARQWRWGWTHYNPLGTCALLVYKKINERDRLEFLLTRLYNARARSERGRAHTTNGRLLFNGGDLDGALAETETGAQMAPEVGATRYHHAAMLALNGRLDEAMLEVLAAVKCDERFAVKAAKDEDFDSLRNRQDFQELILKQKRAPAAGHP